MTSDAISPGQIALAVGGTLLLVAIGIGAALLLLRGGDDQVASADPPAVATAPAEDDPAPDTVPDEAPPAQDIPQAEPPQGQLQPQPAPDIAPDEGAPPQDGVIPEGGQPAPGDPPASEDAVDMPRLFTLRTLPSGTSEESTTIRQTTRDDEVVLEQTTMLDSPDGEVTVRATRVDDADARLQRMIEDATEELSVQGLSAYLVEDGRLVWLLPSEPGTLIEVIAPDTTRIDQLLTIGNGLELLR